MNDSLYHVALNGQSAGPFSLEQLREMWKTGQVSAQTLYWQEGQPDWRPLGQIASSFGDVPPPLRPPVPPGAGMPYPGRGGMMTPGGVPPTSGLAVASLVLGLLSLIVFVTCLPAVICGHMALSQIKASGGRIGGRGLAIGGLICGYIFMALLGITLLGIVAAIALPVFNSIQNRGTGVVELAHGKQIALAIKLYEADHDGKTPPYFATLSPSYISDQSIFRSSLQRNDPSPAFDYLIPNVDGSDLPPHTLMLRGRYLTIHHLRVYVYADATGELKRDP